MNLGDFDLDPNAPEGLLPALRFERAPDELPARAGARAVVREALIPFIVWADVPVRVLEPRKLGRMEVFLLEAGLSLGQFALSELEMATGVPAKVVAESASKLLRRGTFTEIAPGTYAVDQPEAERILTTKNVEEEQLRWATLAYFPRQDVVIGHENITRRLLAVVKKLRAPRQAPFPPRLDRRGGVAGFLATRIQEGRVLGFPHKLIGLGTWDKEPPWPDLSPCYFGRGYVFGTGDDALGDLEIWGHERRRTAPRQYHGEQVKLAHVEPLIREWLSLADRFGATFRGVVDGLPPFVVRGVEAVAPCHFRVGLSGEEASTLAVDRWLTDPLPITARSPTAKVDVRVSFEPIDGQAADLFALDQVARGVERRGAPHSAADFADQIRLAHERYPLSTPGRWTRARVEERLWSLKRFVAVYAHREKEDFAYA